MVQTGETIYGFQGQAYRIRERKGAGGEGTVYLTDQPGIVAKIYHNPTAVQERKLRCMLNKKIATKAPNGTSLIAWPKDILYQNGAFAGYTMPLIEAGKPIFTLYHDKSTREFFNDYNWTKSLCVAMNLAHLVDIIHNCDCVIGDMNPGNIIVHPNGLVSILDVDSFDKMCIRDRNMPQNREALFQISFALGLDETGASRLLGAAAETGIHYRNPEELAYAFALRTGASYEKALELKDMAHAVCDGRMGGGKEKARGETPSIYTRQLRDAFGQVQTEEELEAFFREHAGELGRLHETAYEKFHERCV